MPTIKRPPQPDNPAQYQRFVEAAREAGLDETDRDAMDRAFDRVDVRSQPKGTAKPTQRPKPG
jgi:hypothetical protein